MLIRKNGANNPAVFRGVYNVQVKVIPWFDCSSRDWTWPRLRSPADFALHLPESKWAKHSS